MISGLRPLKKLWIYDFQQKEIKGKEGRILNTRRFSGLNSSPNIITPMAPKQIQALPGLTSSVPDVIPAVADAEKTNPFLLWFEHFVSHRVYKL